MKNQVAPPAFPSVWQDLVYDFLEMACFLRPEEQALLLGELQKHPLQAESIEVYPCFAINGRAVIVCEGEAVQECWLYFVKKQQIQKWKERGALETV